VLNIANNILKLNWLIESSVILSKDNIIKIIVNNNYDKTLFNKTISKIIKTLIKNIAVKYFIYHLLLLLKFLDEKNHDLYSSVYINCAHDKQDEHPPWHISNLNDEVQNHHKSWLHIDGDEVIILLKFLDAKNHGLIFFFLCKLLTWQARRTPAVKYKLL